MLVVRGAVNIISQIKITCNVILSDARYLNSNAFIAAQSHFDPVAGLCSNALCGFFIDDRAVFPEVHGSSRSSRTHSDKVAEPCIILRRNHIDIHVKGKLSSVMYAEIPAGYSADDLKYDFVSASGLSDHISKGEIIGTETAVLNGTVVGTAVVTAAESSGYIFTAVHIIGILGAAALIIIVLFAVMAVRARKARKRRSRARVTGGSSRMERRRQRHRF